MPIITIPRGVNQNEKLIAISRKTYEEFMEWQRKIKSARTFKSTTAEKKAVERGRREIARGEYVTLEELQRELEINNK